MSYPILSLHLYPIKSCGGFSVSEAEITATGLRWDRHWMIVNPEGIFLTQRKDKRLAKIKTAMRELSEGLFLEVTVPNYEIPFLIPTFKEPNETVKVQVWSSEVQAHLENSDINEALSEFLQQKVSLVRFGSQSFRKSELPSKNIVTDVSFVDSFPILVVNAKSLADLNSRMDQPVPVNRFRANIVIDGHLAYEEDHWKNIKINQVQLKSGHACSRCTVTTIDQETGEGKGPEPLKTLAEYRKQGNKVNFGQYIAPTSFGKISLQDRFEVIS